MVANLNFAGDYKSPGQGGRRHQQYGHLKDEKADDRGQCEPSQGARGPAAVGDQPHGGQAPGSQATQDGRYVKHSGLPGNVLLLA